MVGVSQKGFRIQPLRSDFGVWRALEQTGIILEVIGVKKKTAIAAYDSGIRGIVLARSGLVGNPQP